MAPPPQTATTDSETLLAGILRLVDLCVVLATGALAYWLREGRVEPPPPYLAALVLAGLLTLNTMQLARAYRRDSLRRPIRRFGRVAAGWGGVLVALITVSALTKTSADFSRIWLVAWFLLGLAGLFLVRLAVAVQIAHWHATGRGLTRIAVVGTGEAAARAAQQLRLSHGQESLVVGFFEAEAASRPAVDIEEILGGLDDIAAAVRDGHIEVLIVALPWSARDQLENLMARVRRLPVNVRICTEPLPLDIPIRGVGLVAGLPLLDLWHRPLSAWDRVAKALEDRVLATLLLVPALPLMLLIAVAVRLDSRGPVLFRQERAGFNDNRFRMLKFRTMAHRPEPESELRQAQRSDTRVTSVGAWLRRTSLDELPQLFNVLKGDMSLVGPRPHAVAHDAHYADLLDEYLGRQRVKPGMTGWAQVNGLRGATETPELMHRRVEHDLYYIDNWSVLFDLKILCLTLLVGFMNENAY
jgi:putative colanic acid biosynthesis UDP-glucose lipid carrier transferase